jgi:hypothetical protein
MRNINKEKEKSLLQQASGLNHTTQNTEMMFYLNYNLALTLHLLLQPLSPARKKP